MENDYLNPEPVPAASQLALLPFLAAVEGFLTSVAEASPLRITIHRTVMRERMGYLQQACAYLGSGGQDWRKGVGRLFPVNTGIIGEAFRTSKILRTRFYPSDASLMADLAKDMAESGDDRNVKDVASSYLAIPFVGSKGQVVLILYADSWKLNFFADEDQLRHVHAMCEGLSRLLDRLQEDPFSNLRNFPLEPGEPTMGARTLYKRLQESIETLSPPKLSKLENFNYEASVN